MRRVKENTVLAPTDLGNFLSCRHLSALARATAPALGGFLFQHVAMSASFVAGSALLGLGTLVALRIRPEAREAN